LTKLNISRFFKKSAGEIYAALALPRIYTSAHTDLRIICK